MDEPSAPCLRVLLDRCVGLSIPDLDHNVRHPALISIFRFSALAMAGRSTFAMDGAMRLLVARRIWIASPAFWPRIRSITSRAFCGEVRRYRASALACIVCLLLVPLR